MRNAFMVYFFTDDGFQTMMDVSIQQYKFRSYKVFITKFRSCWEKNVTTHQRFGEKNARKKTSWELECNTVISAAQSCSTDNCVAFSLKLLFKVLTMLD